MNCMCDSLEVLFAVTLVVDYFVCDDVEFF